MSPTIDGNFIIFVVFIIIDIIFCIKKVPIFAFLFGLLQIFVIFGVFFPDANIPVYYDFISGFMALVVVIVNVIKYKDS